MVSLKSCHTSDTNQMCCRDGDVRQILLLTDNGCSWAVHALILRTCAICDVKRCLFQVYYLQRGIAQCLLSARAEDGRPSARWGIGNRVIISPRGQVLEIGPATNSAAGLVIIWKIRLADQFNWLPKRNIPQLNHRPVRMRVLALLWLIQRAD